MLRPEFEPFAAVTHATPLLSCGTAVGYPVNPVLSVRSGWYQVSERENTELTVGGCSPNRI
jgi:hypothetical protein